MKMPKAKTARVLRISTNKSKTNDSLIFDERLLSLTQKQKARRSRTERGVPVAARDSSHFSRRSVSSPRRPVIILLVLVCITNLCTDFGAAPTPRSDSPKCTQKINSATPCGLGFDIHRIVAQNFGARKIVAHAPQLYSCMYGFRRGSYPQIR